MKQETTCVSQCNRNYVNISNICEKCDDKCAECKVENRQACTACDGLLFPYLINDNCQKTCPDTLYGNLTTHKCEQCISPCATCSNSSSCNSCILSQPKNKLYVTQCVEDCPANISVAVDNICLNCSSNCKTCAESVNACTSCEATKVLSFESKKCLDFCPSNTHIQNGSNCYQCDQNCQTCQGSLTNCTSCIKDLVLV